MDARRTVLRVIARLNVGGPARHVVLMSAGLEPARWRTVLATGRTDETEAEMLDLAAEAGLRPEIVPGLGRRLRPSSDLRAFFELLRLVRRHRPDVICTHTAKAGTLGRLAAIVHRVPVRVHTFHGHVFHGYFGSTGSRLARLVERALARATTRILAVSEEIADDLVEGHRIAPRERVSVIRLGLDLEPFRSLPPRGAVRRELGVAPNAPFVVTVGRLVPIKDHALLLDAFARVAAARPEARLALVGDGPCRAQLESRAARDDLAGRVLFTGWRRDLPAILADADVAALSSRNEGTPVALIEAAAAGVPAVSTDVGGVRQVVRDGETGRLVPPGDADALAAALIELLDDPAARRAMGGRARQVVAPTYCAERLCREIAALYEECLREVGR